MQLSNIYFAYKNYINDDYGASWDWINQLIKKHNVDERLDRITTKDVTEDIVKSSILIKKGYYAVSFNKSKVSSVEQITGFHLYHTGIGCDICFDTDGASSHDSNVHVIVERKEDLTRIAEHVELQKANISKEQIFEKIHLQEPYIKKHELTDLLTINKEYLLIKGIFKFSCDDDDLGDEYPYFGILLQNDGTLLIEVCHELWNVLLIDEKYYFVTHWQKPEAGGRGLIIYTLEGKFLKKVFADHSDAT
ncbi:MAG: hypothetical protein COV71_05840 [Candidatus Omnitrophica bacterium CG11_big_fil_rev_8_21_14_0_20_41_12]|nr:MAG: hypothetical protein COV71_05840 [Candidatus Omnitrophica bacterium CG11_big_fil_rev_8_21_14_0_20_41_12]